MARALKTLTNALSKGSVKVIDLTQPLGPSTPVIGLPHIFGQSPGFSSEIISKFDDKGPAWYWSSIHLGEHTGTHFDAPGHWITGRNRKNNTTDTIPAGLCVGPACVIDCSRQTRKNEDFLLTPNHIKAWEKKHGKIPAGAWLLMRTDWSKRIKDTDKFLNVRGDGPHTPGFTKECSEFLAHIRLVIGVGVETVGTDAGQAGTFNPPFPNHHTMHGAGKFGLASLCNLDKLPPTGAIVIAAPLKIVNGSGSPLRVLALVEK